MPRLRVALPVARLRAAVDEDFFAAAAFFPAAGRLAGVAGVAAFFAVFFTVFFAAVPVAVFAAVFFAAFEVFAGAVFAFAVVPPPARSTSFSRPSKRLRMSVITSALSLLRWLAWPLVPRLLPVRSREASLCFCTRSRARSRAVRARVMRDARALASSARSPLIRLSSYSAISFWLSRRLALARVIGMRLLRRMDIREWNTGDVQSGSR